MSERLSAEDLAFALHQLRNDTDSFAARQAVDNLDDHIAALEAENARLREAVAEYRDYVRDGVSQGSFGGEMMLQRGIKILSDDPDNDEWWDGLKAQALSNPKSLLSQLYAARQRDGED